jgi:hypothetical protein
MAGRGGDGAAFLSPVSSLRRAEADQRRAQQERMRAVPLPPSPSQSRAKRKQAEDRVAEDRLTAAALKRQRQSPPVREHKARVEEETPRYLSYERGGRDVVEGTTAAVADRRTPRELAFPPVGDGESVVDEDNAVERGSSNGERWSGGLGRSCDTSSDQEERALALFARYKVRYGVEMRRVRANDRRYGDVCVFEWSTGSDGASTRRSGDSNEHVAGDAGASV